MGYLLVAQKLGAVASREEESPENRKIYKLLYSNNFI